MFKVTTITNQRQRVLALEGSLVDPWLSNLKGRWDEELRAQEGAMFVIDLTKVTIVSQHGENILFQMFTDGARLVGNSPFARMVIGHVERRRNLQREERKDKAGRRASLAAGIVMLVVLAGRLSWASTREQPPRASDAPVVEKLIAGVAADHARLSNIPPVTPQMPRGPLDVLNEYEQEMTSISDGFSQELAQIIVAVRLGQISASESEDLIWERYQIAIMQFQAFSALHSALQHEMDQTRPVPPPVPEHGGGEVVVAELPFSSLQLPASLVSYLNLTQSQVGEIQVLIGSDRQRLEPLLTRLNGNRQRLAAATEKGKFDEKLVRKLATQQSRLMAELIVATSRFQAELYAVLTPEQQTKVDDARRHQLSDRSENPDQ
ncbi:MAG TPA: Spy/CpxP family protein refolding chaperone [Terriglobales bacterium]|nr:Spy/CpxP family protein refolding chaperone [Terriglobales bacterium]